MGGEAVAYVGKASVGGTGSDFGDEYIARRGSGGWSQSVLQPDGRNYAFYLAFSTDLSVGFLNAGFDETSSLSPGAPGDGYTVLYSHSTLEGNKDTYTPLFAGTPAELPEEFITYQVPPSAGVTGYQVSFAGTSADSSEALLEVHGSLTPGAVDVPKANNLYVSHEGAVSLVNILPDGITEPNATFGAPPPIHAKFLIRLIFRM